MSSRSRKSANRRSNRIEKPFIKPAFESLENRCLLSGTITISGGVVTVTGTVNSDTIAGGRAGAG